MRTKLLLTGLGMMLAGCASSGPLGKEVLTGSLRPDTARVVFYRSSAFGFAIQPSYMIDGTAIANSQPGGFAVCDVKPGRHEVSVANMPVNVNLFGGIDKATLDLKAGTTTYLSAQPQPGLTMGIITLTQVADGFGQAETKEMHKIEAQCSGA